MIKPILFNTEMVNAILDGRKTQTRRLVKPNFRSDEYGFQIITNTHTGEFVRIEYYDEFENETRWMKQPYEIGDILWVRETWGKLTECDVFPPYEPHEERFIYRADRGDPDHFQAKWHPSIHMPKDAARIFLRVKDVRVEKLHDISVLDAINEGFCRTACDHACANPELGCTDCYNTGWLERLETEFALLWDNTVNKADLPTYGWDANPWVWVIEFERCVMPEGWPNV